MSPQQDVFNRAIEEFNAEQEEVRFAASFASGRCHTFWILVSTLNVILQVTLRSEISITSSLPLSKSWSLMIKNGYWRCML